jgi:LAO/AO transport system kinase
MTTARPSLSPSDPPARWRARLAAGDRATLARLFTFAESSRSDHQRLVHGVLATLAEETTAYRVALSGPPGAGKSTLIEALGSQLVLQGQRLAVLTVDPSSPLSGGSLLADKTRMTRLSSMPGAFVRSSATAGALGGVSEHTAQCMRLCEHAGFDLIFLETVGVGQSELEAALLVDVFIVVVSPSSGDELSGMKRGITEQADLLLVNKLDESPELAIRTRDSYASALRLMRGNSAPQVITTSATSGSGVDEVLRWIQGQRQADNPVRRAQRIATRREMEFWRALSQGFQRRARELLAHQGVVSKQLARAVAGECSPGDAASRALQGMLDGSETGPAAEA